MASSSAVPDFLAHSVGDTVAVATRDLEPGDLKGGYLDDRGVITIELRDSVPLGHKLALADLGEGEDIIEYGVRIGVATEKITRGSYVHTHNLRSARWQNSRA